VDSPLAHERDRALGGQSLVVSALFKRIFNDAFARAACARRTRGYTPRFGLVRVGYATQERHPRPSAEVYARIARARRIEAELFQPRSVRDTRLKRAQGHDP
jgi:hypothetical protein